MRVQVYLQRAACRCCARQKSRSIDIGKDINSARKVADEALGKGTLVAR